MTSSIEIDLPLECRIGFYTEGDVVPEKHSLNLKLLLEDRLVLVNADGMGNVFDYDPICHEVRSLAAAQHYETQEYLLSQIVRFCARFDEVIGIRARLEKSPVMHSGGEIAVCLELDRRSIEKLRV